MGCRFIINICLSLSVSLFLFTCTSGQSRQSPAKSLTVKVDPLEYQQIKTNEGESLRSSLRILLEKDFKIKTTRYFNIAYRCSDVKINELARGLLFFHEKIYSKYFSHHLQRPVSVVYFRNKHEYTRHLGDGTCAYYFPETHTLFTYPSSGIGSLWHEVIHAYVHANCETKPQKWFDEGFASFYEMSFVAGDTIREGYINWRHPEVKVIARQGKLIHLKEFLTADRFTVSYGTGMGRLLFCYLWTQNKLVPFVREYTAQLSKRNRAAMRGRESRQLLERLLGKNIEDIQRDLTSFALQVRKNQKLKRSLEK